MSQSNWPDPTRDETEPRRWPGWVIAAIIAGALGVYLANNDRGDLRLPQVDMPRVALPDLELRDRSDAISQPAPSTETITEYETPVDALIPGVGDSVMEGVPFESCLQSADGLAGVLSQQPAIIEDTAERRVLRYKFETGDLTVICSRADDTMTILNRD